MLPSLPSSPAPNVDTSEKSEPSRREAPVEVEDTERRVALEPAERLPKQRVALADGIAHPSESDTGKTEETSQHPTYGAAMTATMSELNLTPSENPKKDFLRVALALGEEIKEEYGIPAEVVAAQACLESDYGESELARDHLAFFGMKAGPEYTKAKVGDFRAYNSIRESFIDYAGLIKESDRYKSAFQYKDKPRQFLYEVIRAGYAGERNAELITKYVESAEATLKLENKNLGPVQEIIDETAGDEKEGEKTVWGSIVADIGSMGKAVVEFLRNVGETIGDWFGVVPKEDEGSGEALNGESNAISEMLNPDAPVFTFLPEKTLSVSSPYGASEGFRKNPHTGIDIILGGGDSLGQPILASCALKVVQVLRSEHGGNEIILADTSKPGITYGFSHLEALPSYKAGDTLKKGDVIGKIGVTGTTTGPHLHFSAKKQNEFIDPTPFTGLT